MNIIRRFQTALKRENLDVAVLLNNGETVDSSFFYFTGLRTEYEILIIPKTGEPIILASQLEYERVKKTSKVRNLVKVGSRKEFERLMKKHLKGKTLGLNQDFLSLNLQRRLKKLGQPKRIKDVSALLADQRSVKSVEEEKLLYESARISKKIFEDTIVQVKRKKLKTELDIKNHMESLMRQHGCAPSFPTIVASGKNASMPHHEPQDKKLTRGFCIIDFGVNCGGYCSDITRTIYIGKPSEKEIELYYELLGLQEEAIKDCQAGYDYYKIYDSVKKILGDKLIHGLGHGLGIDVHEPLSAKPGKRLILKIGNYLTVEPGVYEQGKYGIRIEDDVLITKKGPIVFSKAISKELIILPRI